MKSSLCPEFALAKIYSSQSKKWRGISRMGGSQTKYPGKNWNSNKNGKENVKWSPKISTLKIPNIRGSDYELNIPLCFFRYLGKQNRSFKLHWKLESKPHQNLFFFFAFTRLWQIMAPQIRITSPSKNANFKFVKNFCGWNKINLFW